MTTGDSDLDARIHYVAAAAPPLSPEQVALISGLMKRAAKDMPTVVPSPVAVAASKRAPERRAA